MIRLRRGKPTKLELKVLVGFRRGPLPSNSPSRSARCFVTNMSWSALDQIHGARSDRQCSSNAKNDKRSSSSKEGKNGRSFWRRRLSRSTAGLPSAAIPSFWIRGSLRHNEQHLSESSPSRNDPKLDLYSETEILSDYDKICSNLPVALLSERSSLRQPRPGTAPMPRMCHRVLYLVPCQRCFVS
jgi:hypothetical protein